MRERRVLIEFTQSTKDDDGNPKRAKGDRMYVDARSAASFVDLKVAKRVTEKQAEKAAPDTGAVGGAS